MMLDRHEYFRFITITKRTINANNATYYLKQNKVKLVPDAIITLFHYIISPRVTIKEIILISKLTNIHPVVDLFPSLLHFPPPPPWPPLVHAIMRGYSYICVCAMLQTD